MRPCACGCTTARVCTPQATQPARQRGQLAGLRASTARARGRGTAAAGRSTPAPRRPRTRGHCAIGSVRHLHRLDAAQPVGDRLARQHARVGVAVRAGEAAQQLVAQRAGGAGDQQRAGGRPRRRAAPAIARPAGPGKDRSPWRSMLPSALLRTEGLEDDETLALDPHAGPVADGLRLQRLPDASTRPASRPGARCSTSTSGAPTWCPTSSPRVKGEANFEQDTLTKVIEARAKATSIQVTPETLNNPEAFNKFQQAQGELSGALSRLMVVSEQYPDLQGQPGLSRPARDARRHREPHHGGAQPLHQDGAGVQRARAQLPDQPDGQGLRATRRSPTSACRTKRRSRRRRRSISARRRSRRSAPAAMTRWPASGVR